MLLRTCLFAACLSALSACQPADDAPPPSGSAGALAADSGPTQAAASTAPAPAEGPATESLGEFRIVSVLLGTSVDADQAVAMDRETFSPKDPIYASVLSIGAHQGLRLSARWLAPDGATIAESVQPVVPTAPTAITFNVRNPDPWPVGEYRVLIAVNGRTLQTRSFSVR